jgi:hypothetical protein
MEALPKIVRQRLGSKARPGLHPQADLLVACAERQLSERERTRVIEHLSRCEDCREVVFLAIPQPVPAEIVGKNRGRAGWLAWPAFRWSAAAACVVVVGTAVALLHRGQNGFPAGARGEADKLESPAPSTLAAKNSASSAIGVPSREVSKDGRLGGIRSEAVRSGRDAGQNKLAGKLDAFARPNPKPMTATPRLPMQFDQSRQINGNDIESAPLPAERTASGMAISGPMLAKGANGAASTEDDRKQAAAAARTAAPSAMRENVELPASSTELEVQSGNANGAKSKDDNPGPALPVTGGSPSGQQASTSSTPATVTRQGSANSLKKEAAGSSGKLTLSWTLTAGGALQRSRDAGRTWERVFVADNEIFKSFAAVQSEVWVGGVRGVLYHSSDLGLHWIRVIPVANGESLHGEIIQIEFSDIQSGKVSTAEGETWTTGDSGNTWQKN